MTYLDKILNEIPLIGVVILFSAYFLGIKFPDWDFKMRLRHRSILTHSPLILLLFIRLYEESKNDLFRFFLIGFSLGLTLHFIFDLYPKGWGGGALIKIPFTKISCNPKISKRILLISIIVSVLVCVLYTKNIIEFYFISVVGLITLLKDMIKEKKLFRPLLSFYLFILLVGVLKYEEIGFGIKTFLKFTSKQIEKFF